MRAVLGRSPCPNMPLILCSKGIEESSGKLLHDVAHEVCPTSPVAVLSGPTFAHEVAAGLPTAVTLACEDRELGEALRGRINLPSFRTYCTDDVAGAEVGGAVKNVLAIACGVAEGRGLGQNARAALIARGFAEMTRFGLAMGGRRETLAGLSGLGDLVLTCSSTSSRNFSLGKAIGEGRIAGRADEGPPHRGRRGPHRAGARTASPSERDIDMPLVDAVVDIARRQGRRSTSCWRPCSAARRATRKTTTRSRSRCPSSPSRRSGWDRACSLRPRAGRFDRLRLRAPAAIC